MNYIIFPTNIYNSKKKDVNCWNGISRVELLDLTVMQIAIGSKSQYVTSIVYKRAFVDDFHIFYNKPPPLS